MENLDLDDLIPHRGRMRLIDAIERAGDARGELRARVRADWPLCAAGRADPLVLIEVVAQAAAALVGWRRRRLELQGGRGWLVGVRKTRLTTGPLSVGLELRVRVEVEYELESYAVFSGRVEAGERELARVEIQTFRPDDGSWRGEVSDGG